MKATSTAEHHKGQTLYINEAGKGEFYLVATAQESSTLKTAEAYAAIAAELNRKKLAIVHERIFGSLAEEPAVRAARADALASAGITPETPLTCIEGSPEYSDGLDGIIIHAVACQNPDDVWTLHDGHVACGRGWRRGDATFLILQNIHGKQNGPESVNTPPIQTLHMLERAEHILSQQGACFQDVIRTWFYLDDILGWYDEFNKVRSAQYRKFDIMPGPDRELMLPASTGIRGSNLNGSSGVLDLFAVIGPPAARPEIKKLSSSTQKDAFCYGSAFSRGALIQNGDVSTFQISGTAAIDKQGMSLYPDDIRSQISCTLDKTEELLDQVGGSLADICAATVFVKRLGFIPVFWEIAAARGLDNFPAVCIVADICREELLFEIDAEAAIRRRTSNIEH